MKKKSNYINKKKNKKIIFMNKELKIIKYL